MPGRQRNYEPRRLVDYHYGRIGQLVAQQRRDRANGDSARPDKDRRRREFERFARPFGERNGAAANLDQVVGQERRDALGEFFPAFGKGAYANDHSFAFLNSVEKSGA